MRDRRLGNDPSGRASEWHAGPEPSRGTDPYSPAAIQARLAERNDPSFASAWGPDATPRRTAPVRFPDLKKRSIPPAIQRKAQDILHSLDVTGRAPPGTHSGGNGIYQNNPIREGNHAGRTVVPPKPAGYYGEYDLGHSQRLIVGRDGDAWYSFDHYLSPAIQVRQSDAQYQARLRQEKIERNRTGPDWPGGDRPGDE